MYNKILELFGLTTLENASPANGPHPGDEIYSKNLGANIDERTTEQRQAEDIQAAEVYANAQAVNWIAKPLSSLRKFPDLDQWSTSGCVAFTTRKILGVTRFLKTGVYTDFSAADIYTRRTTLADGMNSTDPATIVAQGVTLNLLAPSDNLTEAQINAVKVTDAAAEVRNLFRLAGPKAIVLATGDIDAVASVIQATGKAVMTWFFFTASEWSSAVPQVQDVTLVSPYQSQALRHSVTAVDYFLDAQGRKCLMIEDSAHFGGLTRRTITEDFYKRRNFLAQYFMNFATVNTSIQTDPPAVQFATGLSFITWSDALNGPSNLALNTTQLADVKRLQTVLQTLTDIHGAAYFPTNIAPTGYYGALTASSVLKWQIDAGVSDEKTLLALKGYSFGPASIAVMNKILSQK